MRCSRSARSTRRAPCSPRVASGRTPRGIAARRVAGHDHTPRIEMYRDPEGIDLDPLSAETETAIEVLGELGDEAGLARAWMVLSDLHWSQGRLTETSEAATRAAEHARRRQRRREVGWALGQNALCAIHGPMPVAEGLSWLERLLRAEPENRTLDANLSGFVTVLEAMSGQFRRGPQAHQGKPRPGARPGTDVAGRQSRSCSAATSNCSPATRRGRARHADGREECSARSARAGSCRPSRSTFPARSTSRGVTTTLSHCSGRSRKQPAPTDREWQIKRTGDSGAVARQARSAGGGGALAREGVALAADSEYVVLHADVLLDLAEVLRLAGRPEEAEATTADAVGLYERKGNVAAARTARAAPSAGLPAGMLPNR